MLDTDEKIELSNLIPIPLPKTPQPPRRKEIPCSQSSTDTNLSTQSRRSVREVSRSPLKERSTNIGNFITGALPGLNGNYRVPKLEIADSMEDNLSRKINYLKDPSAILTVHVRVIHARQTDGSHAMRRQEKRLPCVES